MIDDVEAVERAESEIDRFILKRDRERAEANRTEELWRRSEARQRRKVQIANGRDWVAYLEHLALCCERRAGEYRDRSREVAAMVAALADETPDHEEVA